jgi:cell division protein FtsQ
MPGLRADKSSSRQSVSQRGKKSAKPKSGKFSLFFKALSFVILLGGLSFALLSGHIEALRQDSWNWWMTTSQRAGFKVKNLIIDGHHHCSKTDILQAVSLDMNKSIFDVSPSVVREKIEKLGWVKSAMVSRRLPHTLYIRIVEHHPIAFWQKDAKLHLIDNHGQIIKADKIGPFTQLPILTGEGAVEKAPVLIEEVSRYSAIASRMTGAVYISKRRWDLILDNKLRVQLPEVSANFKEAIKYLDQLNQEQPLQERDIVVIDLRVPDRVFFYLSQEMRAPGIKLKGEKSA